VHLSRLRVQLQWKKWQQRAENMTITILEMFLGHFSLEENSQNRNDFVIKLEILD
jgi:hypothetical protein